MQAIAAYLAARYESSPPAIVAVRGGALFGTFLETWDSDWSSSARHKGPKGVVLGRFPMGWMEPEEELNVAQLIVGQTGGRQIGGGYQSER